VRRLLQNQSVRHFYAVSAEDVLSSFGKQDAFFYRVFPQQVETGPNKPTTFNWVQARTRDGTNKTTPREMIHLLSSARDIQLKRMEVGQPAPKEGRLFTEPALKEALPEVSRVRLEQTLYAEYPELRPFIEALTGGKTDHSISTLAVIWRAPDDKARQLAGQLVEIGFFEERGTREERRYWVPFLYRPALSLVQGTAEDS